VLTDQQSEEHYIPLNHIRPGQANFEVIDSLLSEEGVLGFEYGYSLSEPSGLTVWEGQFGDFVNGAQVVIDQFISSGESKWLRMSGLVMLLPHGMEGQGPEHSSARLERFLQMSAEDNWQVCNLTTPANYFHALRRQVRRNYRKPLIIMSPKSLLRHKLVVSDLADMAAGARFRRVIPETTTLVADAKVQRIVLCSGKVYYDLFEEREKRGIDDVAIVRIEQLYPWPKQTIAQQIARYPNASVIWCQEEHANQGAWMFVDRRLQFILDELEMPMRVPFYVGRKAAAAPATGSHKSHVQEHALLIEQALTVDAEELPQPFRRMTRLSSIQGKPLKAKRG
jgi:2-oxoglutarate dehydrogenase E1 component